MPIYAVVFLIGTCLTRYTYGLVNIKILSISLVCGLVLNGLTRLSCKKLVCYSNGFCFGLMGFCWASLHLIQLLAWQLPKEFEGKNLSAIGIVNTIPESYSDHIKFTLKLQELSTQQKKLQKSVIIQLNWYKPYPKLVVGQRWHLTVKIKRPHGFANPGVFNNELYLLQNKIKAQGYVRADVNNSLLADGFWQAPIAKIRQKILEKMQLPLKNNQCLGFIEALTIGAKQNITAQQWQILRATGTNHLMAISGLHIGLVAGFLMSLVNFLWRRMPKLALRIPTPNAAIFMGLMAALLYSLIAGFSIPTQRALMMLAVFSVLLISKRQTTVWQATSVALLGVLIIDPLASFSVGFWLSFAAVVFIIYGTAKRYQPKGLWWRYGRTQWVVTLGLLPITLFIFQQASLNASLANLIAIPWVSFTVVPMALMGALIIIFFPYVAGWLLKIAAISLSLIFKLLAYLASIQALQWQQSINQPWVFISISLATLLLLAPRGFPGRWLGLIWFLPIFYYKNPTPNNSQVWLSVLDVGQGLASVIRTQHHTLIYDTGPSYGPYFDAGSLIIMPYLRYQGIDKIDGLVISHGDNDHRGGAYALLQAFSINRLYTSAPSLFEAYTPITCEAGQKWQWDKVQFEFLAPASHSNLKGNNRSCVLRVSIGSQHILLAGDIEKPAEHYLLQTQPEKLGADILIAPHHGSLTSSSWPFIKAVQPKYVVFSAGYLNRFHFPKDEIVQRYQVNGAKTLNTATCGMIGFALTKDNITVNCYRDEQHGIDYKVGP